MRLFTLALQVIGIWVILTSLTLANEPKPKEASCDYPALEKVVFKNSKKKLQKFIDNNPDIDINCRDKDGNTVLIVAGAYGVGGKYKTVPILLANGADPNARNKYGQTSFLLFSQHEFFREDVNPRTDLVNAGADPTIADYSGMNAIHYASLHHSGRALGELVNLNVDPTALTKQGSSAVDIAEYGARIKGLQLNPNLGEANRRYYNFMSSLNRYGATKTKRYEGYIQTTEDGSTTDYNKEVERIRKEKESRQSGLSKLLSSAIIKSEGTGRKCNHLLVIGNFTGLNLNGQIFAKLENGKYQEYGDKSGGYFRLPSGGVAKHQIWLTQGGSQRLMLGAGGQSSRADYINFDVSAECPHGDRSLSKRSFVVEKNNANGMLSIFEDKDGDGRRDLVPEITQPEQPVTVTRTDQCAKIDLLATKLNSNSTAMMYDDTQLEALYSTVSCQLGDEARAQRKQIKGILSK